MPHNFLNKCWELMANTEGKTQKNEEKFLSGLRPFPNVGAMAPMPKVYGNNFIEDSITKRTASADAV